MTKDRLLENQFETIEKVLKKIINHYSELDEEESFSFSFSGLYWDLYKGFNCFQSFKYEELIDLYYKL